MLPVGPFRNNVQKRKEGDIMTDYEMIMIFLTILTLLFMATERRNGR